MLSVVNCELPGTGTSVSILVGVMCVVAIGVLMMAIARRSMNRLSAVAVLPVLLLVFSAAPSDASEECVTDTTEAPAEESTTTVAPTTTVTTVAPTTTTVPPATTTTVPPTTTTTAPRISLSITSGGTISSVSVSDGIPTTLTTTSWIGTISGTSTTFTVTGDFDTVQSVSGATCGTLTGSFPIKSVTCSITGTTVVLQLSTPT